MSSFDRDSLDATYCVLKYAPPGHNRFHIDKQHRYCYDCGTDITHLAKNTQRCKECNEIHRRRYLKEYNRERHKKERSLGTTDFSEHRNKDFKREEMAIHKEMIKLGLRKPSE